MKIVIMTSSFKLEYLFIFVLLLFETSEARKRTRSTGNGFEDNLLNSVEHIWSTTTVAVGDTAVIHCSFDALFQQLKNINIDWVKDSDADETDAPLMEERLTHQSKLEDEVLPVVIATGKTIVVKDKRIRVFRPHNSVLSVLIIRKVEKKDGGVYGCNLAGSTTRHKFMVLNVTDSKIEAQTSSAETRVKVGEDATLWCNATGYPMPIVYWTREDRNRKLQDGSYQYWGNGLPIRSASEWSTGIYVCYLDNFVQPVVNYKFSVIVEDGPWKLDGYKMRFDSSHWFPASTIQPIPTVGKSFLLMCDTRGSPNPPPSIKWYRGKEALSSGKLYYIIEDSSDWRENFVSSTLVIMRYHRSFDGRYKCVATNGFRLRKQKFYLSETGEQPAHIVEPFSRRNHRNNTKISRHDDVDVPPVPPSPPVAAATAAASKSNALQQPHNGGASAKKQTPPTPGVESSTLSISSGGQRKLEERKKLGGEGGKRLAGIGSSSSSRVTGYNDAEVDRRNNYWPPPAKNVAAGVGPMDDDEDEGLGSG